MWECNFTAPPLCPFLTSICAVNQIVHIYFQWKKKCILVHWANLTISRPSGCISIQTVRMDRPAGWRLENDSHLQIIVFDAESSGAAVHKSTLPLHYFAKSQTRSNDGVATSFAPLFLKAFRLSKLRNAPRKLVAFSTWSQLHNINSRHSDPHRDKQSVQLKRLNQTSWIINQLLHAASLTPRVVQPPSECGRRTHTHTHTKKRC